MLTTKDVMNQKSMNDCIMDLMGFLVIAEQQNDQNAGVTATQALESVQVMLGYDDERFEQMKDVFRI